MEMLAVESTYPGEVQEFFDDQVGAFKEARTRKDYSLMGEIMYSLLEQGLTGIETEIEGVLSEEEKSKIGWI